MIVPRRRLLVGVAVVGLPAGALAAVVPEALGASLALLAAVLLLAALDAVLGAEGLADVRASAPEVVRLADGRPAPIDIDLHGEKPRRRVLRAGLVVDEPLRLDEPETGATLPAAGSVRLRWSCVSVRRGVYQAGPCVIESPSPLGFWSVRASLPVSIEVRVYPTLLRERRSVAALFLGRGSAGLRALRPVGKGREFEKLREYVPGDAMEDIHWKATARRGRPITKLFQVERTQEVYVVIDASRLSARPSGRAQPLPVHEPADGEAGAELPPGAEDRPALTVLDRFVTAALVLSLAAERQGDRYGLVVFSNGMDSFVRAGTGRAQHRAIREALVTLHPRLVDPDFEELFAFLRTRLRRRALLFVLTSLDDPALAERFARAIAIVSTQHLVLVNQLRPEGAWPLFSGSAVSGTDEIYRRLAGHLVWSELLELGARLRGRGVPSALLEREQVPQLLLEQYFRVKGRQLL